MMSNFLYLVAMDLNDLTNTSNKTFYCSPQLPVCVCDSIYCHSNHFSISVNPGSTLSFIKALASRTNVVLFLEFLD